MASAELLAVFNARLLKGVHAQCKQCEVLIPKGEKCRVCEVHSYDDMEKYHGSCRSCNGQAGANSAVHFCSTFLAICISESLMESLDAALFTFFTNSSTFV